MIDTAQPAMGPNDSALTNYKIDQIQEAFKNLRDRDIKEIKEDIREIKDNNVSPKEFGSLQSRVENIPNIYLTREEFLTFKKDDFGEIKAAIIKGIGIVLGAVILAGLGIILTR